MGARILASLSLIVAACQFVPREGFAIDGGEGRDGDDDAAEPACNAWPQPPTGIDPCTAPAPTGELNLCTAGTFVYSTTDGTMLGAPAPASRLDANVRIVAVDQLVICAEQTLAIIGAHPVVFVVHGRAEIAGTLDASASQDAQGVWQPGPGGDLCGAGTGMPGASSAAGAGGGAGGGFGRSGGDGGKGDTLAAVTGGASEGAASLSPIRGGCRGGAGGDGNALDTGGRAGPGGGGVHLAVRDALVITGSVRACGGPGIGGQAANAGGGGGGAGGGIFLDAPSVQLTGAVCANGGGGGGGANDGGPLHIGGDGARGTCALVAAMNGTGGDDNGKPGGKGGFGQVAAEDGIGADEGGGGGGGAVGRLRIETLAPELSGIVTPPAEL